MNPFKIAGPAAAAALLAACSSTPKPAPNAPSEPMPLVQSSLENPQTHFDKAMDLLQQGKAQEADAELHAYLESVPKSKSARYLVEQIETPIDKLFPKQSFRIRLPKKATLSTVAKLYLGNSLAFWGLARYNGIDMPSTVHDGQTLRIPKTPSALAARHPAAQPANLHKDEAAATAAEVEARSTETEHKGSVAPPPKQPTSHVQAEHYYRAGLVAFQQQDLDAAIAAWHKALAADPGFSEAQIHLLEAQRLKKSLQALRK